MFSTPSNYNHRRGARINIFYRTRQKQTYFKRLFREKGFFEKGRGRDLKSSFFGTELDFFNFDRSFDAFKWVPNMSI